MNIKEKLNVSVEKDGVTYYLYGPDIDICDIDRGFDAGYYFWQLSKPIENASLEDVIECVDVINVWFSDFQIYKFILKEIYGAKVFTKLSEKRWSFLKANKNRFKLLFTRVGDYGCYIDEFEVICFDTKKNEYIFLSNLMSNADDCFQIRKLVTDVTDFAIIYETIKKADAVGEISYDLKHDKFIKAFDSLEYEPLFEFYDFVRAFYFYFIADGNLISFFSPESKEDIKEILKEQNEFLVSNY